jgi:hypothetical protein
MTDLLNEQEREAAARMGWEVCWVYCLRLAKCIVQVLPTPNNPLKSADGLMKVVTLRAQAGDQLAQRIMGLVLNPPPPRKKAK